MKNFVLIAFVVASTQLFASDAVVRVTQQNLDSYQSTVTCEEVNPLPPIDGLTGPLYFGYIKLDMSVAGEVFHLNYEADTNAAVTWTKSDGSRHGAYRSCEKAKQTAMDESQISISRLSELLDKVKNADIDVVIQDTQPPVKYCRISEARLLLYAPSTNHYIHGWKEVFKPVPCP
jgi:hypothetical protein